MLEADCKLSRLKGFFFSGNNSFSRCTFWLNDCKFHFINYLCLYFSLYVYIYFISYIDSIFLFYLFFLLLGMVVTTAPLEPLWKKNCIDIIQGAKKTRPIYNSRVFFPIWINEKTVLLYTNTVFKFSLKCTKYNGLVEQRKSSKPCDNKW
jgi:hypothetical protein